MLKTIKQNILQWWNELDKKYFLGMLLFSSFVFFPLVSQRLTNAYDGMWTTAEYRAGGWELSNGRWLWPVFSFLRFSLQLEPINAVVCLMLLSGLFTPVRSMPHWAYLSTYVNPMHYFIDAIRTVFVRGGNFSCIAHQVFALSIIAFCMNLWAVISYRKNTA